MSIFINPIKSWTKMSQYILRSSTKTVGCSQEVVWFLDLVGTYIPLGLGFGRIQNSNWLKNNPHFLHEHYFSAYYMSCTLFGVFQILYTPLSPQKSFVGASKSMINKYIFYTSCNHLKALFFFYFYFWACGKVSWWSVEQSTV
jgi:hypothetical protein